MGWDGGRISVYETEPSLLTRNFGGWDGEEIPVHETRSSLWTRNIGTLNQI
jgi:hypothetical protein